MPITIENKAERHVIGDLVYKYFKFTITPGAASLNTGIKNIFLVLPFGQDSINLNGYTITSTDAEQGVVNLFNPSGLDFTNQQLTIIGRVG